MEAGADFLPPQGDVDAWVPAGIVYMVLGDELARRMACGPQEGRREASELLLGSLMLGLIRAKARNCAFNLDDAIKAYRERFIAQQESAGVDYSREAIENGALERDLNFPDQREFSGPAVIPQVFWEYCLPAPPPISWATGDFYWECIPVAGVVSGVEFAICDLPCADEVRAFIATGVPVEQTGSTRNRKGGRPPSPAWPSFCAELVAYAMERPAAVSEPRDRVLSAVLERLAQAGHDEPPITEARKVVRAVQDRMQGDAGRPAAEPDP